MFRILVIFVNLLLIFAIPSQVKAQVDTVANSKATRFSVVRDATFEGDTTRAMTYLQAAYDVLYHDSYRSFRYADRALKIVKKYNWKEGELRIYHVLCELYFLNRDYDALTKLTTESLALAEKLGWELYKAHFLVYLGECYLDFSKYPPAQQCYSEALQVYEKAGKDSLLGVCYENIGNFFRHQHKFTEALEHYDRAYRYFEASESEWGKATVLQSKAYLYLLTEDYPKSEKLFLDAFAIFNSIGSRFGRLNLLTDICNLYYTIGNYERAIATAGEGDTLATYYRSWKQISWAAMTLYRTYKKQHEWEKALYYLEKMDYHKRLVKDENVERRTTLFRLTYDNKRKDLEIQKKIIEKQETTQQFLLAFSMLVLIILGILWWQNRVLRKKNLKIQEALLDGQTLERKRMAAELHDNLGSSLAAINWYLFSIDKEALSTKEKSIYDAVQDMIASAYTEVRSLSHNLLPKELEEEGLEKALSRLKGKLNEYKKVVFELVTEGLSERPDRKTEFELYSIVLELTNNILKHSGATKAKVSLIKSDQQIVLSVTDNGKGIGAADTSGMGLQNVRNRVEGMNGTISIAAQEGGGTAVAIRIPLPNAR